MVCLGLYFDVHEILPFLKGDFRFNKTQKVSKFSSLEVEVRACVEGQFIAMRSYAEEFGFNIGKLLLSETVQKEQADNKKLHVTARVDSEITVIFN